MRVTLKQGSPFYYANTIQIYYIFPKNKRRSNKQDDWAAMTNKSKSSSSIKR